MKSSAAAQSPYEGRAAAPPRGRSSAIDRAMTAIDRAMAGAGDDDAEKIISIASRAGGWSAPVSPQPTQHRDWETGLKTKRNATAFLTTIAMWFLARAVGLDGVMARAILAILGGWFLVRTLSEGWKGLNGDATAWGKSVGLLAGGAWLSVVSGAVGSAIGLAILYQCTSWIYGLVITTDWTLEKEIILGPIYSAIWLSSLGTLGLFVFVVPWALADHWHSHVIVSWNLNEALQAKRAAAATATQTSYRAPALDNIID